MIHGFKAFMSARGWALLGGVIIGAALFLAGGLVLTKPPVEAATAVYPPAPTPTHAPAATPVAVALAQPQLAPQAGPRVYSGDVLPDRKVAVAAEVIGQVLQVNVDVGDPVKTGDVLLRIDSTTLEAQRAQALAGLQAAQAQLDGLLLGADAADIAAARAALTAANSVYAKALAGPTNEDLEIAESQMRQAEAAVQRAQAAYDRVAWNPAIAALPESQQLQQATFQLAAAQAQYDKIVQGATEDVRNGAYAQVVAAQAQVDRLTRGATQPMIDAAQAQIRQAETALFLTQVQVDKATVRAPIDGVVAKVNTSVGANAAPGAPIFEIVSNEVKIVIAVEETRLAELSVGQSAAIRVNAYPDRTFAGEIVTLAPELNAATRTAEVTLRAQDDAGLLAPGMFATVELAH